MSSIVGTPLNVALPNTGDSGDVPITVPSGVNAYVVSGIYYDGANLPLTSVTLGGVAATLLTVSSTDYMGGYLAYGLASPGSTSIQLVKSGAYSEGPTCQITWLNVDNTSDYVRDTDLFGNAAGPFNGSVTSQAGDVILLYSGSDGGGDLSGAITDFTQIGTEQVTLADKCRVYQRTAAGSTTSATGHNNTYAILSMIAIKSAGGGTQTVEPPLFTNTNTLYSPVVSQPPTGFVVEPPLLTNSQSFYSPTVSGMPDGARGQWIVDNTGPIGGAPAGILYNDVDLPADADKWFHFVITTPPATGTLDILPDGRFTFIGPNPETMYYQLYVDNVAVGSPQLVELYTQDESQTVNPPLLTNVQAFYAPTVSATGSTSVSPSLLTNTQTFYSPVVLTSGAVVINPPLVTNTSTVFAATVVKGAGPVFPGLLVNTQAFYSPIVFRSDDPPGTGGGQAQKLGMKMSIGL